jgi:hypothetical protein
MDGPREAWQMERTTLHLAPLPTAGAALGVQHAVMVPAMLGVMLWRYGHYSR